MRLNKLEPHVVQPTSDNSDVDLFLNEIEEESRGVRASQDSAATQAGANSGDPQRQTEEGLIRFAEFLKMRLKMGPRSRRGMAIERYQIQIEAVPSSAEQEIRNLTSYRKYA